MAKKRTKLVESSWKHYSNKGNKCPKCGKPAGISFGYNKNLHFCAEHAIDYIKEK